MEETDYDNIEEKIINDVMRVDSADTSNTLHEYNKIRDEKDASKKLDYMLKSYLKRKQLTINFIKENSKYE